MQALKRKGKQIVQSKHMLSGVFTASFLESTIVPIPLEAVLVPLMQARRDKLWQIALVAMLGCMVGAMFGYALGYYIFEISREWLIANLTTEAQLEHALVQMREEGFWFVLTLGIVPIPLQIAMVAAGATQYSILLFLTAIALSRALRYFGLAYLVYVAGNKAEALFKQYKVPAIIILCLIIFTLWWLTR